MRPENHHGEEIPPTFCFLKSCVLGNSLPQRITFPHRGRCTPHSSSGLPCLPVARPDTDPEPGEMRNVCLPETNHKENLLLLGQLRLPPLADDPISHESVRLNHSAETLRSLHQGCSPYCNGLRTISLPVQCILSLTLGYPQLQAKATIPHTPTPNHPLHSIAILFSAFPLSPYQADLGGSHLD